MALCLAIACDPHLHGQDDVRQLHSHVHDRDDVPIAGAFVIVKETLDGAQTDSAGGFSVPVPAHKPATLIIRVNDTPQFEIPVAAVDELPDPIVVRGIRTGETVNLDRFVVTAGSYPIGTMPGIPEVLTPIEVVTTPGANADLNRALQTLPGVQPVDEGNALYVRGGDARETRALINGAIFPSPAQLESPTGTFAGTVNPFLTDKIYFSSGGFDARYGNSLSGIVDLETQGRPDVMSGAADFGFGKVSIGGTTPLGATLGVRGAYAHEDLRPYFDINGTNRSYDPAPRGDIYSGSAVWAYRPCGEIKFFALDESYDYGTYIQQPSYAGLYASATRSQVAVLSWKDEFDRWLPSASISTTEARDRESFGAFRLNQSEPQVRGLFQLGYNASDRLLFTAGMELTRVRGILAASMPVAGDAQAPGASVMAANSSSAGWQDGAFLESDWMVTKKFRVLAGLRTDRSTLAAARTWDPRLSLGWNLSPQLKLTLGGGVYHQVPDTMDLNPVFGRPGLPAMRATHAIAGLQYGKDARFIRLELYQKDYSQLALRDVDFHVRGNLAGRAQGVDLYGKSPLPLGLTGRISLSLIDARRTDPTQGIMARSPNDIPVASSLIIERRFPGGVLAGLSWRAASGKPVTDIVAAKFDPARGVYQPQYGIPYGARLPSQQRLDLEITKVTRINDRVSTVFYVSAMNLLNHDNTYAYDYSSDYGTRAMVPTLFPRSVYVGVTVTYR